MLCALLLLTGAALSALPRRVKASASRSAPASAARRPAFGLQVAWYQQPYHGGSLSAGYEFMVDVGFGVRPMVGISVARQEVDNRVAPTFELALGCKLW